MSIYAVFADCISKSFPDPPSHTVSNYLKLHTRYFNNVMQSQPACLLLSEGVNNIARQHQSAVVLKVRVFSPLQQEAQRRRTTTPPPDEIVEIPDGYKGLVIGRGGDNLRNISTKTGAKLIRKNGEVYIRSGDKQQRQQARLLIGMLIVSNISYVLVLYKYVYFTLSLYFVWSANGNKSISQQDEGLVFTERDIQLGTPFHLVIIAVFSPFTHCFS